MTVSFMEIEYTNGNEPVCKCLECNKQFLVEDISIQDGHKTSPCCGSRFKVIPSSIELFLDKYLFQDVNNDERIYTYETLIHKNREMTSLRKLKNKKQTIYID